MQVDPNAAHQPADQGAPGADRDKGIHGRFPDPILMNPLIYIYIYRDILYYIDDQTRSNGFIQQKWGMTHQMAIEKCLLLPYSYRKA